ncbi:MAG TPA: molybdenum cofactor guanylyltransferase [Candidatus Deferrimicrobiaceae bacterium]
MLAGGASRRMGRDKALLDFRGRPLIQAVLDRVGAVFNNPFVVSNTPERFPFLSCPIVPDRFPGKGPLAGIDAALRHARTPFAFACGCDMPFLSEPLLKLLAEKAGEGIDLVLPSGPDGAEPLCAIWGRSALPAVEQALAEERLSLVALANKLSVHEVTIEEVAAVDPSFASFRNFNTRSDWERRNG